MVAYYPFMAPMPQWEVPHTKDEQAQRTVGLLHKDFHVCVKNQEQIFSGITFGGYVIPLHTDSQKQLDYGSYINRAQYLRGTADEL